MRHAITSPNFLYSPHAEIRSRCVQHQQERIFQILELIGETYFSISYFIWEINLIDLGSMLYQRIYQRRTYLLLLKWYEKTVKMPNCFRVSKLGKSNAI